MEKPTVFISYKRDKSDIVDKLVEKVGGRAEIKRDTKEIGAWESITEFMNSIRQQDFAILLISDNYLKSIPCMYEVLQLMKDDNWLGKTMIMLAEELKIFGAKEQLSYVEYWYNEYNILSDLIKNLPPESVSAQAEDLKKISRIKDEIGSFLHIISDRNIPADDVYEQINKRLEKTSSSNDNKLEHSVRLGKEAISLLVTMCNGDGMMNVSTSLESYSLIINGIRFVDCSSLDNRSIAKWTDAIRKLEHYDLIESNFNSVYRVTQSGYTASEDLEKQIGEYRVKCPVCHYHGASDKNYKCPICEHTFEIDFIILEGIRKNPYVSRMELSKMTGRTQNSVSRILKELTDKGLIERVGSAKAGYWKSKK